MCASASLLQLGRVFRILLRRGGGRYDKRAKWRYDSGAHHHEISAMAPFDAWENFYIIVGSSAGALTGLQFVVMALVSEQGTASGLGEVNAFGTPTVVHFCAVLLISAIVSALWPRVAEAGWVLTLCGIAGLNYVGIVLRRALRQTGYKPVFEDWLWHTILPF